MAMDAAGGLPKDATLSRKHSQQQQQHIVDGPIYRQLTSQPPVPNPPVSQPDSDEHKMIANYAARLAALKTLTGQVWYSLNYRCF